MVGYFIGPVDPFPIPDSVPILGRLDELVVVPAGVIVARKMIPDRVVVGARAKAKTLEGNP